jgi:hypothetical protein
MSRTAHKIEKGGTKIVGARRGGAPELHFFFLRPHSAQCLLFLDFPVVFRYIFSCAAAQRGVMKI